MFLYLSALNAFGDSGLSVLGASCALMETTKATAAAAESTSLLKRIGGKSSVRTTSRWYYPALGESDMKLRCIIGLAFVSLAAQAAPPQAAISNARVRAQLYLPDAQ